MSHAPVLTALPSGSFRRTPWKNGGGVTIDIAGAYPPGTPAGDWSSMVWRFGRTSIAVAAPFSDFSGFERMQVVVEGAGLVLDTPSGEIDLRLPFRPVRYDGGTPITSRLERGPVEVVNLIADPARCAIDLVALADGGTIVLKPGIHVIYAPLEPISGSCGAGPLQIDGGDALRVATTVDCSIGIAAGPAVIASISLRT